MESDTNKNKQNEIDRILLVTKKESNKEKLKNNNSRPASLTSRQFKPNIQKIKLQNQKDNTNEVQSSPIEVNITKSKRNQKNYHENVKPYFKDNHHVVPTMSVFSSGVAASADPKSHRPGRIPSSTSSSTNKSNTVVASNQLISDPDLLLLQDTRIKIDGLFGPVTLPLSSSIDSNANMNQPNALKHKLGEDKKPKYDFLESFLYSKKKMIENDLLLIQLPTLLPLKNLTDFMQQININEISENETTKKENSKDVNKKIGSGEHFDSTKILNNAHEGWIGRLQYHMSGRMVLNIGNHSFNVKEGTNVNFLQQIYCINNNDSPPSMGYIGKVINKLVVSPDIDGLLQKQNNNI